MIDYKFFFIIMIEVLFALFLTFFIHELGHKYYFNKYKIKSKIRFYPIKHFKGKEFFANCSTVDKIEEDKFYRLGFKSKKNILMGGIKAEVVVLFILSLFLFIQFSASYYFSFLNNIFFIYLNIFISLMALFIALALPFNLFKKGSDLKKLENLIKGRLVK
jgi:hypothetical protein